MKTATMELDESFEIPMHPDTVWALLCDPRRAVACIPGAELGEEHPDGSFEGSLTASLGPTVVTFTGTVLPEFDHAGKTGSLVGSGEDRRGRSKAQVTTTFSVRTGASAGTTALQLSSRCSVIGGVASFVSTGGPHLARRMLAEFADNVAERSAKPVGEAVELKRLNFVAMLRLVLGALGDALRRATPRRKSRSTS